MKKLFLVLFLIPFCPPPSHAQGYPTNYELLCPSGSVPFSGPSGTSFNPTTGKYRANTCIDPFGNISQNITGALNATGTTTICNLNGVICPTAFTNAGIQAAVNATPLNGTLFLPTGTYLLTATTNEQIKVTQAINIICAGFGTDLRLQPTAGNVPLLHIVPSGAQAGLTIQNCQFNNTGASSVGTYAIQVDTSAGNTLSQFVIDHINIASQFPTGGIFMNNASGDPNGGVFSARIKRSFIIGGINCVSCGDSLTIEDNNITDTTGATIGVNYSSISQGAASLRILNNYILSLGAAIHIGSKPFWVQIDGNEMQTNTSTVTGSNGAYVDIDGASGAGNNILGGEMTRNTFQIVNGSTLNGLRINFANNFFVDCCNSFSRGSGGAIDIVVTANAVDTRIWPQNFQGVTLAQALSDAGTRTFFTFGGEGNMNSPICYYSVQGTVPICEGFGSQRMIQGANGATFIYDGATQTIVEALSSSLPSQAVAGFAKLPNVSITSRFKLTDQGQCTMASGACPAQSLGSTYSVAPLCFANWTGTGTLAGTIKIVSTVTTVTPSSSTGTDTAQVNWSCFGN